MLDLCAAPGGKSTHALSVLPEGSLLVSNEVMRNRAQILAENITKWGATGTVVTNNDPADFAPLTALFDVILTDVPCSGEGMFRKDAVAVSEWSEENVATCWQRQRRIISDIWPALKPGGLLIYST
jgi:16S rRNA C967 or C1407 C5-methylase (RsmB/RsmF family)